MKILTPGQKISISAALLFFLTVVYFSMADSEYMRFFTDPGFLIANIRELGVLGPILIILLMSVAIVFNPLPSAPVALTAGAVYGHTMGTVYVVAGAELGAILAFLIARWAGFDLTRRFFGETGMFQRINSQRTLTILVFVSRLIPFMSFDLVSYAAGLSPIKFWRFALATLLGLIPVSFALAHFGSEIDEGNYQLVIGIVLMLGLLAIAPLLVQLFRPGNTASDTPSSDAQQ